MPRAKTIPDQSVFAAIEALLARGGDKSVSFSTVAQATGLAGPTLVQRFKSRDGMVKAARLAAWDTLDEACARVLAETAAKGPQALLKGLRPLASKALDPALLALDFRDDDLRQRAMSWRATVESALALRLGSAAKSREAAVLLFSAWQGQLLWSAAGGDAFRLKDAVRRLT
ncbi:MAG: TetR family transcriptional regulator [Tabrizicola sp.]|nr:TetR family transcriptional regulator [Tabrizicola sp.]